MARLSATYVFFLLLVTAARADWTVATSNAEQGVGGKVEHRRIVLDDDKTGERIKLELALFSTKSATLRVTDNPSGHDLATVAQRENGLAGVNGGYFDPENQPVGLLISAGKLIAPLRKARLLSGVMVVSDGKTQLLRFGEYSPKQSATAALQCGPFLVDRGQPVPGLNATRGARRTFVARTGSDRVAIGFCSNATLATLATILVTPSLAPDLKIQRALNLDGGSSSAFWFAGERGVISISEQKTVRNFVLVVPK